MSGTFVTVDVNLAKTLVGIADIDTSDKTLVKPRNDLLTTDFKDIWWVGDYSDKTGATNGGFVAIHKFKTAEYLGSLRGGSLSPAVTYIDARDKVLSEAITTEFTAYSGFCLDDSQDSFGKKSEDGKTITWYSRYNNRQSNQLNEAGVKYYFRFFG